ncbi:DELTA-thalatoxin-Avl1a-like [Colossoma macropomum]|uniref:DELTA-thalatoxin-Avl1a-like n=1 Tax=Colossoma macropomum TaxID=42526 RepID=UPI0018644737|nr:DELTA-thalatoxin-Avl1a-like [Colossoma macropomum]
MPSDDDFTMHQRAMAAAAASTVLSSATLFGTSIEQISQSINTNRNVAIQFTNRSDGYILANPRTYTSSGECHCPPQPTIKNNSQEVCSFSKTTNALRGSVGILMYQILNNETEHVSQQANKLVILFSVPFDRNFHKNKFYLGIFEPNTNCNKALYKQIKKNKTTDPITRGKGTGSVITYSREGALVKGTMSAFGRSIIKIELWDE